MLGKLDVRYTINVTQIETFERMLEQGQDSDMLRLTLGGAYQKDGQLAKAIEHLEKAVELNPDYSTAWKALGRVLAEDQQLQKALDAFDAGLVAADKNGDKQVEKEINVFRKRVVKQLQPN